MKRGRPSERWGARLFALVTLAALGCGNKDKTDARPAPSAQASAATAAKAPPSGAPASSDGGATSSTAKGGAGAGSYSGKYTASPAPLSIPQDKDYKGVRQAPDDGSRHVGDGTLSLDVDSAGRVSGAIDAGPASPAIIEGVLADGEIRGTVRRKDPSDGGLTGTLLAKVTGENLEGKMKLAESNAAIVRQATFSLAKK